MSLKSLLLFLIFCLATSFKGYGQHTNATDAGVKSRFNTPQSVQWVHTFKGMWENFHPIEIVLGFDGGIYHGTLHLETGNELFDLHGYHQDGKAMIQEIDQTGRTSGYLVVEIADGLMTGQWWSSDFSRSASISLRDEAVIALRTFDPELLVLTGSIAKHIVNLTIQREESNLLSGFCTIENDETLYRLTGECEDVICDKMRFNIKPPDGEMQVLRCTRQRGTMFNVQLTDSSNETQEGSATILNRYPMKRIHYAGYVGNVDCIYPVLSEPAFDTWLNVQIVTWNTMVRRHLDALEKSPITPGPDVRWSIQASAWIDFTLLTSEKISGVMTMYDPIKGVYNRTAFTFDVKSGKPLSMEENGRRADFTNTLQKDAAEATSGDSDNPDFMAWLQTQDFRHIALSMDGFVLFTDFDPVFGDTWATLKYTDYTESLKRNAFVLDLKR